jgi:hypothetical protein
MTRLERACNTDGWMTGDELRWLEAAALDLPLVVEFGSWVGRSSIALASARKVICVDHWQGSNEHQETHTRGRDIAKEFRENLAPEIEARRVVPITADLATAEGRIAVLDEVLRVAPIGRASMVFIDDSHDEESVVRSIELARMIAAPGAMICGHDYCSGWRSVMRAVDRMFPCTDRGPDSIWWRRT